MRTKSETPWVPELEISSSENVTTEKCARGTAAGFVGESGAGMGAGLRRSGGVGYLCPHRRLRLYSHALYNGSSPLAPAVLALMRVRPMH